MMTFGRFEDAGGWSPFSARAVAIMKSWHKKINAIRDMLNASRQNVESGRKERHDQANKDMPCSLFAKAVKPLDYFLSFYHLASPPSTHIGHVEVRTSF